MPREFYSPAESGGATPEKPKPEQEFDWRWAIKVGRFYSVVPNLNKISKNDHKEVALKLFDEGRGYVVAENLDKFSGLDKEVAEKLFGARRGYVVAENLDKFSGLDHAEVAKKLIDAGLDRFVVNNLGKFSGLDKEVAKKLIDAGQGDVVVNNLGKFSGLDKEVAKKLIDPSRAYVVVKNLDKFSGLDEEVAKKLIGAGQGDVVVKNLDKFSGLDKEMAKKLIDGGYCNAVVANSEKFTGLDTSVAERLILLDISDFKPEIFDGFPERLQELEEVNKKYHLTFKEIILLQRSGYVFKDTSDCKEIFTELNSQKITDWPDNENISGPFSRGAELFGYEEMFKYCKAGPSRHDALHAFDSVVSLYEASGLSAPGQFYNNILKQVMLDGQTYEEGRACHKLNALATSLDINFDKVLGRAKRYEHIDQVKTLVDSFSDKAGIFASWKALKKYAELATLLEKTEILDELQELRQQGKEKLYNYVASLALHPTSQVNMEDVFRFWRNPESFLANEDTHTPTEVHDRKKPSNYVHIPNLDLTAEELRDALVEGRLDSLQSFRALQIKYQIPENGASAEIKPLPARLYEALGAHKDGVKGKARNPGRLFSELNKVLKGLGITPRQYVMGEVNGIIEPAIEKQIEALLYDDKFGMPRQVVKFNEYLAKINLKSDPAGVLAGNDTACCMPFGSGKNNVYMFNPVTSLFTLQQKMADGRDRTIAQSVLTKDKDMRTLIPDILAKMNEAGEHLSDVLPQNVLQSGPAYLAADNIEVAPNYKTPEIARVIEDVYKDFFTEYLNRYGEGQNLVRDAMPVGTGYSDMVSHLPTRPNTFAPLAPVGYSDKAGEVVYQLNLGGEPARAFTREISVTDPDPDNLPEFVPLPGIKGLGYLTFEDTLPVAYLEGKAYSDNQSLMAYLHNMENALIAKDINNAAKGRANMSLKYTDEKGMVRGYILAYEGSLEEELNEDRNDGSPKTTGERVIYISDLASDRESKLAGGKLVQGFAELYKKNYLDKNDLVPMYAEAREATSFRLIQRQMAKIGRDIGVEFKLEELPKYEQGGETMHPVFIRPVKKVA